MGEAIEVQHMGLDRDRQAAVARADVEQFNPEKSDERVSTDRPGLRASGSDDPARSSHKSSIRQTLQPQQDECRQDRRDGQQGKRFSDLDSPATVEQPQAWKSPKEKVREH